MGRGRFRDGTRAGFIPGDGGAIRLLKDGGEPPADHSVACNRTRCLLAILDPDGIADERWIGIFHRLQRVDSERGEAHVVVGCDRSPMTDVRNNSLQLPKPESGLRIAEPLFIPARSLSASFFWRCRPGKRIAGAHTFEQGPRIPVNRWCRQSMVDGQLEEETPY